MNAPLHDLAGIQARLRELQAHDLLQGGSLSLHDRLAELESGVSVELLVIQAARYRELLSQPGMLGDTEYRHVRIDPLPAATAAPHR